ncbi:unnamed protein product [Protopolystoma xenopodis]|uniref:Uncharacterized protein n=1 Tax=Protopolystoma xenopodis TaxID=117903 RepID=A0A448XDL6_9PLAT|nr:unnamed protein product [Protopolystoma xenopodis]
MQHFFGGRFVTEWTLLLSYEFYSCSKAGDADYDARGTSGSLPSPWPNSDNYHGYYHRGPQTRWFCLGLRVIHVLGLAWLTVDVFS